MLVLAASQGHGVVAFPGEGHPFTSDGAPAAQRNESMELFMGAWVTQTQRHDPKPTLAWVKTQDEKLSWCSCMPCKQLSWQAGIFSLQRFLLPL